MSVLDHPLTSRNPAASAPMHEYARECSVSVKREFSLTQLNTLTRPPHAPPRRFHVVSMSFPCRFRSVSVALMSLCTSNFHPAKTRNPFPIKALTRTRPVHSTLKSFSNRPPSRSAACAPPPPPPTMAPLMDLPYLTPDFAG